MSLLDLKQVAIDTAENKVKGQFSADQGTEAIRAAMVETFGTDHLTYKQYRRMPAEFFEFIEETITPHVHKKLEETFNQFAEVKNIGYGDMNKFHVPNTELFPVATIAEGSGNIRRKRLDNEEFEVEVRSMSAGIYEELNRFLAGRVDWAMYVSKLADSFSRDMAQRISTALYGSFSTLGSTYAVSASTADASALKEKTLGVAEHVEAEYGTVTIVGTKSALAKLKPEYYSDAQAGERNNTGYFGVVDGYEVLAMPQFHKNGTDEFGVDSQTLLVLPTSGEKIVKVVIEGDAIVREVAGSDSHREDMQVQHDVIQRAGVMIVAPRKYGMVKFT